jgi:hypothetical protein
LFRFKKEKEKEKRNSEDNKKIKEKNKKNLTWAGPANGALCAGGRSLPQRAGVRISRNERESSRERMSEREGVGPKLSLPARPAQLTNGLSIIRFVDSLALLDSFGYLLDSFAYME